MVDYCDINKEWTLNSDGDLELTTDYTQSLSERLNTPLDFLNIYYEQYGSKLNTLLGESFDEDLTRHYINQSLKQDQNIYSYEIIRIMKEETVLIIELKVNDFEVTLEL